MLTILLDGVAYGMLLFVLASGLSVTLGLMNFINLAHGAFAMVGGYVTALLMNRAGAPFLHAPGRLPDPGDPGRRARTHALSPPLWRKPARSGAVYDRPRTDGDADRQLIFSATSRSRFICRHGSAGASRSTASALASIGCSSSSSAGSSPPACRSSSSGPASARNSARRSTTRASLRPWHQCRPPLRHRIRRRQRARGSGRRARR